jgi:hypothetical protein
MGFLKRKADPISERSKALNAQIASLEAQIKRLDTKLQQNTNQPRLRSTTPPRGPAAPTPNHSSASEPIFEPVDPRRLEPSTEHETGTPDHYNDLGVRKYDLAALFKRWRSHFRGPPASNPKLVTYLAAGSIKGLRPLRYEKRVARNRVIALFIILFCLVWGIIAVFLRTR